MSDPGLLSLEQIEEHFPSGINKTRLAEWYGLTNFDTAIPQTIFDTLATEAFHPWSHFIYDYSKWRHGVLFPLTAEGLKRMEEEGMTFFDPR